MCRMIIIIVQGPVNECVIRVPARIIIAFSCDRATAKAALRQAADAAADRLIADSGGRRVGYINVDNL